MEKLKLNNYYMTKEELLKSNIEKYLNSKSTGGLYGLTIRNDGFLDELIEVIKMSENNKLFKEKEPKDIGDKFARGGYGI
jgi:hypothetical protein